MKQVLHRMTAAITLLSMIAVMIFAGGIPVIAADGETAAGGRLTDTMTWSFADGVLSITGTGDMPEYTWYESLPWYDLRDSVTQAVISQGVTSIGGYAFYGCSSLAGITLPDSVKSIGKWAFLECSSLQSITIPEGTTSIGGFAFYGCSSLRGITIPGSVTSIAAGAFSGCSGLLSITAAEDNPVYFSKGNCLIEKKSGKLLRGCTASVIPADGSVTSIGSAAFSGCSSLRSITIPEGASSIGSSAFYDCSSLQSIAIPESVTSIGSSAFSGCSSLRGITLPEGVTSISESVFYGCSSLQSITLPEGVTSIGGFAFCGCSSLRSIEIPSRVTSIGFDVFDRCSSLMSITVAEDNPVYFSAGNCLIEKKSGRLLRGCTASVIPTDGSVVSIDEAAFYGCSGLADIVIPNSVTSIGDEAFYDCSSLRSAVYIGRSEQWKKVKIGNNNDALLDALRIVIPGDINGDGVVNVEDVTALLTLMAADAKIPGYCDLNGDGKVTVKDVSRLLRMLAGV